MDERPRIPDLEKTVAGLRSTNARLRNKFLLERWALEHERTAWLDQYNARNELTQENEQLKARILRLEERIAELTSGAK